MARILLHTLVFAPDGVSTSVLLSELCQDLKAQGNEITVLTTAPHYNRDEDAEAKQPLKKHLGGLYYTSSHNGIKVIHTFMPRKGERVGGRLRDYAIFHTLSLILGTLLIGRQDLVLVPSPPLTIGIIGWMLAKLKGAALIYNIRELFPELAVQMKILRRELFLYRFSVWMERFIYDKSWRVVVICEMFRRYVVDLGYLESKVPMIPDFVDVEFIHPQPKDNSLASQLDLVDKYVVLYAGNIGVTQSFDMILEGADRLQDEPEIRFLIVGDGVRRSHVEQYIQKHGLKNVVTLPYQPRSVVPDIYATGDLGLVPLMKGTAKTTIPSKIYTILASGRPALVSVDLDSELVWIVEQAQCGIAVEPDNVDAFTEAVRTAYANREQFKKLGENGRHYAEQQYSRHAVNEAYETLIQELMRERRK